MIFGRTTFLAGVPRLVSHQPRRVAPPPPRPHRATTRYSERLIGHTVRGPSLCVRVRDIQPENRSRSGIQRAHATVRVVVLCLLIDLAIVDVHERDPEAAV